MPPKTLTRGSSVAGSPVSVIISTAATSSVKLSCKDKSFQIAIVPEATKLAVTPTANCNVIFALRAAFGSL